MHFPPPNNRIPSGHNNSYGNPTDIEYRGRRKGIFVNKKFQFTFIAYISTFSLVASGLAYASITFYNFSYLSAGLLSVFFMSAAGVFLSQKIAGPIYKIQSAIEASVIENALNDVKLRKNDFFPELETALNTQLHYLSDLRNSKTTKKVDNIKETAKFKIAA
jgi:methyl-accepting chemotaxis protein